MVRTPFHPGSTRYHAIILLLALAVVGAAEVPKAAGTTPAAGVPAWALAPVDATEVRRLLDVAVAAGFPDAAAGALLIGDLVVRGVDAADNPPHHDSMMINGHAMRPVIEEKDGATIYHGAHICFPDGSWLACLHEPLHPDAATVDATALAPIAVGDLRARLAAQADPAVAKLQSSAEIDAWLVNYPADQRPALRAGLSWWPALSSLIGVSDNTAMLEVAINLTRRGVPEADGSLVLIAAWQGQRAWFTVGDGEAHLLLTEEERERLQYRHQELMQKRFMQARAGGGGMSLAPVPAAVRAALGAWFESQLRQSSPAIPADRALAGLAEVLGPATPVDARERGRLLIGRAALPVQLPADAPIAMRVALWDRPSRGTLPMMDENGDVPDIGEEQTRQLSAETRERLAAARAAKANRFGIDDLGALIALVADRGPSRWLDRENSPMAPQGGVPRNVGENALRILTMVLRVDPRLLVGRDPFGPWSLDAQAATATALQDWWRTAGAKPRAALFADLIPILAPGAAADVIAGRPVDERAALTATLLDAWRAHPPTAADPGSIAKALGVLQDAPGIIEVARTWPVEGAPRLVLAAWRAQHGDNQPLDRVLEEALSVPAPVPDKDDPFSINTDPASTALIVAASLPSKTHVARLLAAQSGPLDGLAARRALCLALMWETNRDPAVILARGGQGHRQRPGADAVRRALQAAVLTDVRPLPGDLIAVQNGNLQLVVGSRKLLLPISWETAAGTGDAKPPTLPTDARICDVAALCLLRDPWQWGAMEDGQKPVFDPSLPSAKRDSALALLRDLVAASAERLFNDAKLPLSALPGAAQGNDEPPPF